MATTEDRKLKVFLCHASQDKPIVRELYQKLSAEGWIDPWLDEEKILPGQDWNFEIDMAVKSADAIIVFLSSNSVTKEGFIQRELRIVLDLADQKPEGMLFVIPVRLEACEPPSRLRIWQYADYFPLEDRDRAYKRLLISLCKRATGLGIPAANPDEDHTCYGIEEERILEAAIADHVTVNKATSLYALVRRIDSKNIITVIRVSDDDVIIDEDNVKTKSMPIEFPIKDDAILPAEIILRLVAHDFYPPIQQKKILIPPNDDSELCIFMITPKKTGRLLLTLDVIKHDGVGLVSRNLRTTAVEYDLENPKVLLSIPIILLVQPILIDGVTKANHPVEKYGDTDITEKAKKEKEENARLEAEERIRKEAEERARKKKEEPERKAAQEPARKQAEIKAKREKDKREENGRRSQPTRKTTESRRTEILVAILGIIATIIAGILSSPLIEKWLTPKSTPTETLSSPITLTPQPSENTPAFSNNPTETHGSPDAIETPLTPTTTPAYAIINAIGFESVNVRDSPGYDSSVTTSLPNGLLVILLSEIETVDGTDWIYIKAPQRNQEGWVLLAALLQTTPTPTKIVIPITPTGTPDKYGIGSTQVSDKDGMVMVYVPGGEFDMGSEAVRELDGCQKYGPGCQLGWFLDEEPIHTVDVKALWIDQTEVTIQMYALCVAADKCNPPSSNQSATRPEYYGNPAYDNFPVIFVAWNDASVYCNWAGRRLPTEAEWEKAAIGSEGSTFPWGDTIDCAHANYGSCFSDTTAVGSYELGKSLYGAYDMAGNVWEWVDSWYQVYPDGDTNVSDSFGRYLRVLRGGAFGEPFNELRAANRNFGEPTYATNNRGFRCASDQ